MYANVQGQKKCGAFNEWPFAFGPLLYDSCAQSFDVMYGLPIGPLLS